MRTANRIVALTASILVATATELATSDSVIPESCNDERPLAVIDCLSTQIELLKLAVEHRELLVRMSRTNIHETPPAPSPADTEDEKTSAISERAAWFDEYLQIYAISGLGDARVAHANLDGREYRLRAGDTIRLAKVLAVHDAGIELSISDAKNVTIGLGARTQQVEQ